MYLCIFLSNKVDLNSVVFFFCPNWNVYFMWEFYLFRTTGAIEIVSFRLYIFVSLLFEWQYWFQFIASLFFFFLFRVQDIYLFSIFIFPIYLKFNYVEYIITAGVYGKSAERHTDRIDFSFCIETPTKIFNELQFYVSMANLPQSPIYSNNIKRHFPLVKCFYLVIFKTKWETQKENKSRKRKKKRNLKWKSKYSTLSWEQYRSKR